MSSREPEGAHLAMYSASCSLSGKMVALGESASQGTLVEWVLWADLREVRLRPAEDPLLDGLPGLARSL